MKEKFYEMPLCESIILDPESKVMSNSQWGDTGLPGADLNELTPIVF